MKMVTNTEGRIKSAYIFIEKYIQIQVAPKIEKNRDLKKSDLWTVNGASLNSLL